MAKHLKNLYSFIFFIIGIIVTLFLFSFPLEAMVAQGSELTFSNTNNYSFFWPVAIIGGCIGITLTYVGWKKYKAEKIKKKDSNS